MNNLERMQSCPRFYKCSVPICPLDEDKDKRTYLQGEKKCTLPKSYRTRLGKDLPWGGKWPRELSAEKVWKEKSSEERAKFISGSILWRFKGGKS